MELRWANQLTFPADWALAEHSHPNNTELIIPIGGAIETRIAGQVIVARPGQAMMYPRQVPHAERSVSRQPLRMLYLACLGDPPVDAPFVRSLPDRRCEMLGRWILEAVGDKAVRNLMLQLLLHHYLQASPDEPTIAAVKAYVREHLAEPLSLADLAAVAGASPFHFARRFRAAVGMPPMQYVRRQRVEAARSLLLASPLPLRTIAGVAGFRDEFELSRVFKRETGESPGAIRKARQ